MNRAKYGVLFIYGLIVTGCSSFFYPNPMTPQKTKDFLATPDYQVQATHSPMEQQYPWLKITANQYLLGQRVNVQQKTLPSFFDTSSISINTLMSPLSINDLLAQISQQTYLSFRVMPDVFNNIGGSSSSSSSSSSSRNSGGENNSGITALGGNAGRPSSAILPLSINYSGSLHGILDMLATEMGIWWRYDEPSMTIVFYRTITRIFHMPVVPVVTTNTGSVGTGMLAGSAGGGSSAGGAAGGSSAGGAAGGGGGGGGSGMNNASYILNSDIWKGISSAIKSASGSATVSSNSDLGDIVVTGTPDDVAHVEQVVQSLTRDLTHLVVIDVRVYEVDVDREDNYGASLTTAFKNLKHQYGFSLNSPSTPQSSWATASAGMINSTIISSQSSALGTWSGSSIALAALSSLGKTNELTDASVTTINNHQASIQKAVQTGYLASSQSSITGVSGIAQQTLMPGTVTTGLTGILFPRIHGGKIALSVNLTLNNLIGMQTIGSLSATSSEIQLPSVSSTVFQQSADLHNDDTLILTQFQDNSLSESENGMGSPGFWGLGGGRDQYRKHHLIAAILTVHILQ